MIYRYYESPIGLIRIGCSERAVCLCELAESRRPDSGTEEYEVANNALKQLSEYFDGTRKSFDLTFEFICGTEFQQCVWNTLLKIPYGKTVSYSELAKLCGKPKAVRACATAVGKNPLLIFAPCHRILGKNSLGGFSAGGPENKKMLLELEGVL